MNMGHPFFLIFSVVFQAMVIPCKGPFDRPPFWGRPLVWLQPVETFVGRSQWFVFVVLFDHCFCGKWPDHLQVRIGCNHKESTSNGPF